MIKVNLLPDLVLNRRRDARLRRLVMLGFGAWMGLLALIVLAAFMYLGVKTLQVSSATNEHKKLDAEVNSEDNVAFRQEALEVQASLKALDTLFNEQRRLSLVTAQVAKLTPTTVQLKEVAIRNGNQVIIEGSAKSYDEAGKMLAAFKLSKSNIDPNSQTASVYFEEAALSGAALNASSQTNQPNDKTVSFSLVALYEFQQPVQEEVTE
jgi:hypothetical protein